MASLGGPSTTIDVDNNPTLLPPLSDSDNAAGKKRAVAVAAVAAEAPVFKKGQSITLKGE